MSGVKLVGFGAMNLDTLYQVQDVVVDDETSIEEFASFPGGSAANTIYGLARLGVPTGFIGAVGDDEAGAALLRDFEATGVDIGQIKVKENAATGAVLGFTDHHGRRALYVTPGANSRLTKDDIDLDYVRQTTLVHLSSFVDEQQFELQKWVVVSASPPVKVSFAPGAMYCRRGLSALRPVLAKTDVLFVNEDEIRHLTDADFRTGAHRLLEEGCRIVVVTLGKGMEPPRTSGKPPAPAYGSFPEEARLDENSTNPRADDAPEPAKVAAYLADANQEHLIESTEADVKDSTGAGDAFAAGVIYGLLNEKGLRDSGLLGEIMARFCISEVGARTGLPSLTALARSYEELSGRPM